MASVTWEGYDVLRLGLETISDPPMQPLMEEWADIIWEGNRRGVLSGLDGENKPMPPLRYRNGNGRQTRNRGDRYFGRSASRPKFGTGANLTTAEYQKLTGPRLAPRRDKSRVITNLGKHVGRDPDNNYGWFAEGVWRDVVSTKGFSFLMAHFAPESGSRLPRYDLRPVRPEDVRRAEESLEQFMESLLKRLFGG